MALQVIIAKTEQDDLVVAKNTLITSFPYYVYEMPTGGTPKRVSIGHATVTDARAALDTVRYSRR